MIPVLNTAMYLVGCFVRVSETCALEMAFGGGAAPRPASLSAHTHTHTETHYAHAQRHTVLVCTPWNLCVQCLSDLYTSSM